MFGISVFPGMGIKIENNLKYIVRANKMGAGYIFTSLHIPETDFDIIEDEFIKILDAGKKLGMTVIADISKEYFKVFDWDSYEDIIIRLDFGFTDDEIVGISRRYPVQLNASTLNQENFEKLIALGVDKDNISVCHNYYPRKETGISIELMRERNDYFKSIGLTVMAFAASSYLRRGPLYEGLPTIEAHRNIDIIAGAQELFLEGCDVVIVGDSMASNIELEALKDIEGRGGIDYLIPVKDYSMSKVEKEIFGGIHEVRTDPAEYVVRCSKTLGGVKAVNDGEIARGLTTERKTGAITIDNSGYERYAGELQIVKRDLPSDDRVNIVGRVIDGGRLISRIAPGDKFRFYKAGKGIL